MLAWAVCPRHSDCNSPTLCDAWMDCMSKSLGLKQCNSPARCDAWAGCLGHPDCRWAPPGWCEPRAEIASCQGAWGSPSRPQAFLTTTMVWSVLSNAEGEMSRVRLCTKPLERILNNFQTRLSPFNDGQSDSHKYRRILPKWRNVEVMIGGFCLRSEAELGQTAALARGVAKEPAFPAHTHTHTHTQVATRTRNFGKHTMNTSHASGSKRKKVELSVSKERHCRSYDFIGKT
jgi:hypothetical protein